MRPNVRRATVCCLLGACAAAVVVLDAGPASAATVYARIRVATSLNIRTGPSSSTPSVGRLHNRDQVAIACKVDGQYVRGRVRRTSQWDRLTNGRYISHAYVRGNPTIAYCPVTPAPPPAAPAAGPVGTAAQRQFIAAAVPLARETQRLYGVPASVTIGQAILETNWGRSRMATRDKNFFGIKCFTKGPIAIACRPYNITETARDGSHYPTTSYFRAYASMRDSFRDHGLFLVTHSRYRPAFAYPNNPDRFIIEIHKAGYCTGNTYSNSVRRIMQTFNLYQYDLH